MVCGFFNGLYGTFLCRVLHRTHLGLHRRDQLKNHEGFQIPIFVSIMGLEIQSVFQFSQSDAVRS